MFGEQRIEMSGYPTGGMILQPLLNFVERNNFRSSVQKQSLAVTCRFARLAAPAEGRPSEGGHGLDVRITAGS